VQPGLRRAGDREARDERPGDVLTPREVRDDLRPPRPIGSRRDDDVYPFVALKTPGQLDSPQPQRCDMAERDTVGQEDQRRPAAIQKVPGSVGGHPDARERAA
jgi:hypothetical protein